MTSTSDAKRIKSDSSSVEEVVADVIEQEVLDTEEAVQTGNSSNVPSTSTFDARKHEVRHEVALPPELLDSYVPLSEWKADFEPARTYPFKLDPFQELATRCVDRKESVLVSAHTSAGKTVCAEYAIASALRDKQRVIYTSPIKALSNQKYRELQETFGDVGLMTGDVTINQNASCLVMTTEILRSMLYRGSEVMREVSWVVFDEIHYMRDKERGVVWEETIILLPDSVKFVFLSATIPNALQFARWIVHIHKQPCHVVYTNYRPTPLQHYLFPAGGDGIHLVVDEKGTFKEENFQRALNIFGKSSKGNGKDSIEVLGSTTKSRNRAASNKNAPPGTSDLYKVVRMILSKNLYPVIVFSFSKRECESNAMQMSKLDFNSAEEKQLTKAVFSNAIESLSVEDRSLPQIESILPLLERGIGIHHSGLLPILKEVIEILFQEGLIKVLFATETFSIGLNMPAKTVVFTSVRKFDGKDFRWVSSGEYIQMSGRAGRRGLDDRGIVIMMLDDKMEPAVCKDMIKGQADKLNSAFHLSYNMILNLMRVDGLSPDFILERSFYQFQNGDNLPELESQLTQVKVALKEHENSLSSPVEADAIANYWEIREQLKETRADFRKIIHHPTYSLPFLQPGRLVRVNDSEGQGDFGWAVIINVHKKSRGFKKNGDEGAESSLSNTTYYVIDVLGKVAKDKETGFAAIKPAQPNGPSRPQIFPVELTVLDGISSIRLHLPKDVRPNDSQLVVLKSISEVERRFPDAIPLLDPINDQGIADPSFKGLSDRMEALERCLIKHSLNEDPKRLALLLEYQEDRSNLQNQVNDLEKRIAQARSVLQMDELGNRKRLLRRLGYTRPEDIDVIDVKGRVACEISTGDELLLTELIFSAAFTALNVDQINALLSCFVFQEKSGSGKDDDGGDGKGMRMKEELAGPWRIIQEAARRIYSVSQESGLTGDYTEAEYLQQLRPELMDVVYAWSRGAPFAKICKMTEVFEGSIIRALRRLDELLRQLAQAARSIGNAELENKFNEGMSKIRRDIVFANSLYL